MTFRSSISSKQPGTPLTRKLSASSLFNPVNTQYMKKDTLDNMDAYVSKSSNNFIQMVPDIASAIVNLTRNAPETYLDSWCKLKGILEESVRRGQIACPVQIDPPRAVKKSTSIVNVHGDTFNDDYAYFTNREDPDLIKYLESENRYSEEAMAHTSVLQKVLYQEFISRIDENEESPKVTLKDGYTYYTKRIEGEEYSLHCRISSNNVEQVYLNENLLASELNNETTFFNVGFLRHCQANDLIAYGVDLAGNERYTVYFKNKDSGKVLSEVLENVSEGGLHFSRCGRFVYYLLLDDTERAFQLKRHEIGKMISEDVLLLEEKDEMFFLTLNKSCDGNYLFINSSAQITSETRFISFDDPEGEPVVVYPRKKYVNYTCEHHNGFFYILSNENVKNNFLFRIPVKAPLIEQSRTIVIEHRDFVYIEELQMRQKHLILLERSNCLQNLRIIDISDSNNFENYHYVSFSDLVYSIWLGTIAEESADLNKQSLFESNILRYTFTSLVDPKQVIDYNMDDKTSSIVHMQVVTNYDRSKYAQKRLFATGIDGTAIPMSLVYRKDLLYKEQNPNPCLLYAYGAYGGCISPIFNSNRLSLLDRGFIYAIAHVRGGADMGMPWYSEGKLLKKQNTFNDFISCTEFLIKEGYTCTEKLSIYGRSAGGLLIGAVVNQRPDLFKAVLTEVPFVDVINTMFDSSIPWTAFEYEEWGNPKDKKIYNAMKAYCPYSNISNQAYPNMLVVGGMNDPRVAYFEPAKFVAKLRDYKTDSNLLILRIEDSGHGGSSGQYSHLDELAYEYAFLISTLNVSYKPLVDQSLQMKELDKHFHQFKESNASIISANTKQKRSKRKKNENRIYQWITNLF
ncbi:hypothetical protein ROZALSC1DRAFT_26800 [Rozella allomycis CSF55]|uniref:Prolyl endopeptidase n=1 Tax=Rozella allomycis (strain CSF55) TaxID=988480 RepID=A0A075AS88_ROZAC|nr:Peptidase S9A/B/C, oligopeptidasebeta-propeller domain-containing protein [Rozella allomycis CSF55]RKP21803.1 hypothetical protein ROZALSC1DRAFT_26800 [Rozella allomycis CSF55]|eukprot:EPZ31433.1 Peptidase S9A/B/C, oligopeptidasebeta-propeller domain-containing protein [Rozella allomycis CSF55]